MPAIVLLPGMDGTGRMFDGVVDALKEDFNTIVVSYPGQQPMGYDELAEHVRHLLPQDEPFVLLAESFSGPLALQMAGTRPSGLAGVILCCSFMRNPVPWLQPLRALITLWPLRVLPIWMLSPWLFGRFSTASLRAALRDALSEVSANVLRARIAAVLDVDATPHVSKISVPMLYLQATNDRIVRPSSARHLKRLARQMSIQALEGSHLLLQAVPADAAMAIGRFVRSLDWHR